MWKAVTSAAMSPTRRRAVKKGGGEVEEEGRDGEGRFRRINFLATLPVDCMNLG